LAYRLTRRSYAAYIAPPIPDFWDRRTAGADVASLFMRQRKHGLPQDVVGPRRRRALAIGLCMLALAGIAATQGSAQETARCFGEPATAVVTGTTLFVGSSADEVILGDAADNTIDGGGGHDLICGLAGNDALRGGLGNDSGSSASP
jgi:hemolysin type calcium-binding protein